MLNDAIVNVNGDSVQILDVTLLLVTITLLPTLVVMMTSFTRYVVSLSFLRTAMGTQQTPPNTVLVGMALILTLFTMTPTLNTIKTTAFDPYVEGEITQQEFFDRAKLPLKRFMLRNAEIGTVQMYCEMAGILKGVEIMEGGSMIMPMLISVDETITSISMKGIYSKKPFPP